MGKSEFLSTCNHDFLSGLLADNGITLKFNIYGIKFKPTHFFHFNRIKRIKIRFLLTVNKTVENLEVNICFLMYLTNLFPIFAEYLTRN